MSGFIEGEDRHQATLFPERLDDYVAEESSVRVIDVFIDDLDISGLGFKTQASDTGRPAYHPTTMLKIYVYGYLNRVQSSRRLERETQRNVELMWLTGRLAPDFKTIADFRKDNGEAIRLVCRGFVRRRVVWCLDEHHRVHYGSRSRTLHSVLSRSPSPPPRNRAELTLILNDR
ncbi:MAG: hypothetical protein BMS9Abin29_0923 [Gemmatimonadota bacterium]|nr:MAG: hypothetical protein BMS9Abin29_0923 [Gemmatimonadota bacterium]